MSTELEPRPPAERRERPYRLSVRQYMKMIEAGVFADDLRVELLGGRLFPIMTKYPPHNFAVMFLGQTFNRLLAPDWYAREEKSIVLVGSSRPEPDLAVVRGPVERYRDRDPRSSDLGLLVEVSEGSYSRDRGMKWRKYAAAGVPTYWIVNLAKKRIEVYASPAGRGHAPAYRETSTFGPDDEVPIVLEGRERGRVPVRDVIG
ncbi:MAG: Uma2 family endonuclease [Isosphaeraceae bacterium]